MTASRRQELEELTRRQIAYAIEDDLDGGERLMKEVFEECCGDRDELEVVYREMRRILSLLKEPE